MALFIDEFPQRLAPGEFVIIHGNPYHPSAVGILGKVIKTLPKPSAFGGIIVEVEYEAPATGRPIVRAMEITCLRAAIPENLREMARKYRALSLEFGKVAREAERMVERLRKGGSGNSLEKVD